MSRLSRREFLIGAGLLGATSLAGTCGALAGVAVFTRRTPPVVVIASLPTSTPTASGDNSMIARATWGARDPDHAAPNETGFYSALNPLGWRQYDDLSIYRTLVVHHSVIYAPNDARTMNAVQNLHMDERGWADIGYHLCIGKSGAVYTGRDINVRGTHVAGYNTGSLGICLLGNTTTDGVPEAQWQSLNAVCARMKSLLPVTHLAGHRDFNPDTECPGNTLYDQLDTLASIHSLTRGSDGYDPSTVEATGVWACACGGTT